jgi:hypothetical protein
MQRSPSPTSPRAKLALALILVLAIVLRFAAAPAPGGLSGGFDREMDGFQGSFFTLTSTNYARLGPGAAGGYPLINIEADPTAPKTWYVYANHPPTLALFFWLELELFGPDGWQTAPLEGNSPTSLAPGSIERILRAPMMLASLASILALFWALRGAMGEREALLATLLYTALPLAVLDAGLVNYEPPSILCVLVAFGAAVRFLEGGRKRHLVLGASALALGTAQTFAPLFFAVPLCLFILLHRLRHRSLLPAVRTTTIFAGAALLPILIHGIAARAALSELGQVPHLTDRVNELFGPLTSGAVPFFSWLALQFTHLADASSELFRDVVLVGIVFAVIDLLAVPSPAAKSQATPEQLSRARAAAFALLLFTGGLSVLFFYYRHTADGFLAGTSVQTTFMLNVLPGACALAAIALFEIATTLGRVFQKGRPSAELSPLLRHGPNVLAASLTLLMLGDFARATANTYTTWRAPDVTRPLPLEVGTELHDLLPPHSVGLFPGSLGWTPAVSLYAWRSLLPVTADVESFQFTEARIAAAGLTTAPRYLLLPKEPRAEGAKQLEAFFHQMTPEIAAREPVTSDHWRAWRLDL